jgi:hypothetical protein
VPTAHSPIARFKNRIPFLKLTLAMEKRRVLCKPIKNIAIAINNKLGMPNGVLLNTGKNAAIAINAESTKKISVKRTPLDNFIELKVETPV